MKDEEELENVDDATEDELGKALDEERTRDKSKIEQEARKKVNEKAKKGIKKLKGSLFKSVGASTFTVIAAFVIVIFMSIGIISYIVTMPGFVQQKMYDLVSDITKDVKEWWSGDNAFLNDPNSNDENFVNAKLALLQYLDEMGLNPIGMGFVAYAARDNNNKIYNYISDFMAEGEMIRLTGSYSNGDLLYKYIVASERTYMMNNDGLKGLLGLAPKTDFKGMLSFVTDMGTKLNSKIAVDRSTKSLTITEEGFFKSNKQVFTFDLDSWVGRYGKPIELLVALHIATMSPDLTEEFIDNPDLQTNVQIKVEREQYDADYSVRFKDEDGNMQDSPVKLGKTGIDGDQDKLYEKVLKHVNLNLDNPNGSVYEYHNTDDINAKDITISGLYELITEMNPENKKGYVRPTENDELENCLNWGIDCFLSANVGFAVKNTTGSYKTFQNSVLELPVLCEQYMDQLGYSSTTGDGGTLTKIYNQFGDKIVWREEGKEILNGKEEILHYGYIDYCGAYDRWKSLRFAYKRQCATSSDGIIVNYMFNIQRYIDNPALYFKENGFPRENDPQPTDVFNANNESILAVLVAFDQYIHYYNEMFYGATIDWYELDPMNSSQQPYYSWVCERLYCTFDPGNVDDKIYLNLSKIWIDDYANKTFSDLETSKRELSKTLNNIKNKLEVYRNILRDRNVYIQRLVDDILEEEIGPDARGTLKIADIKKIYETLYDAPSKVNFEEPRILYVVKHWFKDIDFSDAYEKQQSTKHVKLDDVGSDDLEVVMDLTGQVYAQTKQPYVIKGNTVTLEGEEVTDYKQNAKGYEEFYKNAGNGYRAAKKLFTQGWYYVYDGTEASSKGIYYNKILEQIQPGKCADVKVLDGRIYSIHQVDESVMRGAINSVGTDKIQSIENNTVEIVLYNEITQRRQQKTNNPNNPDEVVEVELNSKAKCYYIKVNESIAYKSPVQYDEPESKKSAQVINEVLEAMEIVNKRQVVSFDTVVTTYRDTETGEDVAQVYSGDTAMLTAFNVLENMHTEAAEHIYRDLKEFLIDLGYYTSAEFEAINTNTLKWLVPSYTPENAAHWKQNKASDSLKYGAVIYPKQVCEAQQTEDEQFEDPERMWIDEQGQKHYIGDILSDGFDPDADVIAPADCKIISTENDKIVIEFDGISQPSNALLNGYTMIISGVKPEETINTMNGEISVADAISNKTVIKGGDTIAKTKDERMVIVLMDSKGAYINNVEDYMAPPGLYDAMMLDVEIEKIVELIWMFEGTSDADPNDGDYYTVEYPSTDVPTVGHGVTAATEATWHELGYSEYIQNGVFIKDKIPKEVVDNVSKAVILKDLEDLDAKLDAKGITWGGNQKGAYISLWYNGWHGTVSSMLDDWANKNYASVRKKWLEVCVDHSGTYTRGHQNRRAIEWVFFNTGEILSQQDAYNKCYISREY